MADSGLVARLTSDGDEVALPRYDMALARKADAIDAAEGHEATWRAEWEFLRAAVGDDALRDAVGGARVDSCDLMALDSACAAVRSAYEAPQRDAMRRRVEEAMEVVDGDSVERLLRAADAIGRLESRQGFRRVK